MATRSAFLHVCALAALACAQHCYGDRWDDALALVPPNAMSAVVVPNPKQASDELQQALERMGRPEVALGGRPIDLLRARLGLGAGFDDKGTLVAWTVPDALGAQLCMLVPVTDADTFMKSSLVPTDRDAPGVVRAPGSPPPTYTFAGSGPPMYARAMGKHVLLGTNPDHVHAYESKPGFATELAARLGERGRAISRSGDVLIWAGHKVFTDYAAELRDSAKAIAKAASGAVSGGAQDSLPDAVRDLVGDPAAMQAQFERSAALAQQVGDAVATIDFDALGVGMRSFVRFEAGSELAAAIPVEPAPVAGSAPLAAPSALVDGLPSAPFYAAGGVNIKAMGGIARLRTFMSRLPMGDRLPIPIWLDGVQDKVDGVQLALYPSKLSVLAGGLANDSAFLIKTSDAAAVRSALQAWVRSQQGDHDGVRAEVTWEDARELRDGSKAAAFAVKETVVDLAAAGGTFARLAKQALVGSRGLHGFAAEVPGGLVVTFSQRPDVIERAVKAATRASPTLAQQGTVGAYTPWLMPDADAVLFVGLGELVVAAQQIASAMPGGAADMLPMPDGPVEPIAGAMRSRNGAWEAALIVPSTALAVGFDAVMAQVMGGGAQGAEPPGARDPGARDPGTRNPGTDAPTQPAPTPAPSTTP